MVQSWLFWSYKLIMASFYVEIEMFHLLFKIKDNQPLFGKPILVQSKTIVPKKMNSKVYTHILKHKFWIMVASRKGSINLRIRLCHTSKPAKKWFNSKIYPIIWLVRSIVWYEHYKNMNRLQCWTLFEKMAYHLLKFDVFELMSTVTWSYLDPREGYFDSNKNCLKSPLGVLCY